MKLCCDEKLFYFVVAESLRGATATLFDLLGPKDTVFDSHSHKPAMAVTERQMRVYCTVRWSLFVRGLRLLLLVFEFRSKRYHPKFCPNTLQIETNSLVLLHYEYSSTFVVGCPGSSEVNT